MNNFETLELVALTETDCQEIAGGGFWYDLGVSAHEAWNSIRDYDYQYTNYSHQAI